MDQNDIRNQLYERVLEYFIEIMGFEAERSAEIIKDSVFYKLLHLNDDTLDHIGRYNVEYWVEDILLQEEW